MECKQKKSKGPLSLCADRSAKGRKGLWKYIHSHFQQFSVGSRARIRLQGGGPTFFLRRVVRRASLEEFQSDNWSTVTLVFPVCLFGEFTIRPQESVRRQPTTTSDEDGLFFFLFFWRVGTTDLEGDGWVLEETVEQLRECVLFEEEGNKIIRQRRRNPGRRKRGEEGTADPLAASRWHLACRASRSTSTVCLCQPTMNVSTSHSLVTFLSMRSSTQLLSQLFFPCLSLFVISVLLACSLSFCLLEGKKRRRFCKFPLILGQRICPPTLGACPGAWPRSILEDIVFD